jgi:hypothetical protein
MPMTRREFVVTTAAAGAVLLSTQHAALSIPQPAPRFEHWLLEGDPYTAHVDECGLGGRTWDEAREHALRFRSTPDDRDRYVLGMEI